MFNSSTSKRINYAIAAILVFILCFSSFLYLMKPTSSVSATTAAIEPANTATIIKSNDVDVVEGYSAMVGYSSRSASQTEIHSTTSTKLPGHIVQLDEGRTGLLVKSKDSGTAAEGKGFDFASSFKGDFELDFRVFSKETFYGFINYGGDVSLDSTNPFLDLKKVAIRFTSLSNPDEYFTVTVAGSTNWFMQTPQAVVAIKNEGAFSQDYGAMGKDTKGYGISYGDHSTKNPQFRQDGYHTTRINGTSFANAAFSPVNRSTKIRFDIDTMGVYAESWTWDKARLTDDREWVLIRSLKDNIAKIDGKDVVAPYAGIQTLNAADFAKGYNVSVVFEDVTSNETPLTARLNGNGSNITTLRDDDNNPIVYERYAQMILYSVNGQSLAPRKGFTVTETEDGTTVISKDTGNKVEGSVINLGRNISADSEYDLKFNIWADGGANAFNSNWTPYMPFHGDFNGTLLSDDGFNPYYDIKDVRVKFTAKNGKTFSVDVSSKRRYAHKDSYASVYIPGDKKISPTSLNKGYGLDDNGAYNILYETKLAGSFVLDTTFTNIKFDPVAMKVYGIDGVHKRLIRDLISNDKVPQAEREFYSTLSAGDFAEGFDVDFEIVAMTDNNATGYDVLYGAEWTSTAPDAVYKPAVIRVENDEMLYTNKIASPYDRTAKVKFIGLKIDDIEIDTQESAVYSIANEESIDYTDVSNTGEFGTELDVTPHVFDLLGSSKLKVYKNIAGVNEEIEPDVNGRYKVNLNTFEDIAISYSYNSLGVAKTAQNAVTIVVTDSVPPTIALKTGLPDTFYLCSEQVIVSDDDVIATDNTGIAPNVTITIKDSNNETVQVIDSEGTYSVTYIATDYKGNNSAQGVRTIRVYNHDYADEFTIDKQPTCTEPGSKSRHCRICGDKTDITEIPALGHQYDSSVVIKEATCHEEGLIEYACTVCGETIRENIPKLEHIWSEEYVVVKEPTATEDGYKARQCILCGDFDEENKVIIPKLSDTIDEGNNNGSGNEHGDDGNNNGSGNEHGDDGNGGCFGSLASQSSLISVLIVLIALAAVVLLKKKA